MSQDNSAAVQPTKVLLFSIQDANHPVTADILKKVCEQERVNVQRIAIFQKKGLQAFVEVESIAEAIRVKKELHDCEIFPGSCSLDIEYSPAETINVRVNSDVSYNIDIGKPNRSFWPTIESHTNVELAKEQKLQALLASAQGIPGAQSIIQKAMGGGATNGKNLPTSPSVPPNTKSNNNINVRNNSNISPGSNNSFPRFPSPTLPPMAAPSPLMGVQTRFGGQTTPNFNLQNRPNLNVQNQPNLNLQNQSNHNLQNRPNLNLQNQPNLNSPNQPNFNVMNQPIIQNQPNLNVMNQPIVNAQNQQKQRNQKTQNEENFSWKNQIDAMNQQNLSQNQPNLVLQNASKDIGQNLPIRQNPLNTRNTRQNVPIVTQQQNEANNSGENELDCTGGEGCVTMLFNIQSGKVNCDHLFNLFSCYGNVVMIKILTKKNKPSSAMVQFTDQLSTELAIEHLDKLLLFGLPLKVVVSNQHTVVKDMQSHLAAHRLSDGSPGVVSYARSPNNKFKFHEGDDDLLSRVHAPSKVLHYSNAPPGFTDKNLVLLFKSLNAKMPIKHKTMSRANSKSCSGLIEFSTIPCAVEALMMCSHIALHKDNDQGGAAFTFKLSFSSLSIKE